jgi:hypothetical protein
MSHNPYSPSTAPLPIPPHSKRPAPVAIAAWLFGISYAIGLIIAITKVGIPKTPPIIMGLLLGLVVSAGMLLAICSRRNWGRWLAVILIALNVLVLPDVISRNADALKVLYAAQGVLQLASAVLLFMPASNRWYRPNNSFKPKPLRGSA